MAEAAAATTADAAAKAQAATAPTTTAAAPHNFSSQQLEASLATVTALLQFLDHRPLLPAPVQTLQPPLPPSMTMMGMAMPPPPPASTAPFAGSFGFPPQPQQPPPPPPPHMQAQPPPLPPSHPLVPPQPAPNLPPGASSLASVGLAHVLPKLLAPLAPPPAHLAAQGAGVGVGALPPPPAGAAATATAPGPTPAPAAGAAPPPPPPPPAVASAGVEPLSPLTPLQSWLALCRADFQPHDAMRLASHLVDALGASDDASGAAAPAAGTAAEAVRVADAVVRERWLRRQRGGGGGDEGESAGDGTAAAGWKEGVLAARRRRREQRLAAGSIGSMGGGRGTTTATTTTTKTTIAAPLGIGSESMVPLGDGMAATQLGPPTLPPPTSEWGPRRLRFSGRLQEEEGRRGCAAQRKPPKEAAVDDNDPNGEEAEKLRPRPLPEPELKEASLREVARRVLREASWLRIPAEPAVGEGASGDGQAGEESGLGGKGPDAHDEGEEEQEEQVASVLAGRAAISILARAENRKPSPRVGEASTSAELLVELRGVGTCYLCVRSRRGARRRFAGGLAENGDGGPGDEAEGKPSPSEAPAGGTRQSGRGDRERARWARCEVVHVNLKAPAESPMGVAHRRNGEATATWHLASRFPLYRDVSARLQAALLLPPEKDEGDTDEEKADGDNEDPSGKHGVKNGKVEGEAMDEDGDEDKEAATAAASAAAATRVTQSSGSGRSSGTEEATYFWSPLVSALRMVLGLATLYDAAPPRLEAALQARANVQLQARQMQALAAMAADANAGGGGGLGAGTGAGAGALDASGGMAAAAAAMLAAERGQRAREVAVPVGAATWTVDWGECSVRWAWCVPLASAVRKQPQQRRRRGDAPPAAQGRERPDDGIEDGTEDVPRKRARGENDGRGVADQEGRRRGGAERTTASTEGTWRAYHLLCAPGL